jgi:hypothetical protein
MDPISVLDIHKILSVFVIRDVGSQLFTKLHLILSLFFSSRNCTWQSDLQQRCHDCKGTYGQVNLGN